MKTFIVPTDFSKNAHHASAYAVQLAAQLNARIILMHVFEPPIAVSEFELTAMRYHSMKERIENELEERKQELIKEFGDKTPITCRIYNHELISNIRELVEDTEARLVIIGLTGAGMANFFLGSNTLNIVNNLQKVVLTVPPFASFRPIRKVLFACDMLDVAHTVPIQHIKRILNILEAQLLVLYIEQPKGRSGSEIEQEKNTLKGMLTGVDYTFHAASTKNIVSGIKDFAKRQEADLIAIIPQKQDFLEGLLKTSHTKAMLFKSNIPILTIPPPPAE